MAPGRPSHRLRIIQANLESARATLSVAADLLQEEGWEGAEEAAQLRERALRLLAALREGERRSRTGATRG